MPVKQSAIQPLGNVTVPFFTLPGTGNGLQLLSGAYSGWDVWWDWTICYAPEWGVGFRFLSGPTIDRIQLKYTHGIFKGAFKVTAAPPPEVENNWL